MNKTLTFGKSFGVGAVLLVLTCTSLSAQSVKEQVDAAVSTLQQSQSQDEIYSALDALFLIAEKQNTLALYALGTIYLEGQSVDKNVDRGLNFMREAALLGSRPSIAYLSDFYLENDQVDELFTFFNELAASGSEDAASKLVSLYADSKAEYFNAPKAESYLLQQIEKVGSLSELSGPLKSSAVTIFLNGFRTTEDTENKENYFSQLLALAEDGVWPAIDAVSGIFIEGSDGIEADIDRGYGYLLTAAENGFAPASYKLGLAHISGKITGASYQRGVDFVEQAASANFDPATKYLANLTLDSSYDGFEMNKAIGILSDAAQNGDAAAALKLARAYAAGGILSPDAEKAETFARISYEQGNTAAELFLARLLMESEDSAKRDEGLALLNAQAENESTTANIELASRFLEQGDRQSAETYLDRILQAGEPAGLNFLGGLYLKGELVEKDEFLAIKYITEAYESGFAGAFISYTNLALDGKIADTTPETAIALLEEAATAGNVTAISRLSSIYSAPDQAYYDLQKGLEYLELSIKERPAAGPAYKLAIAYANGQGIEQDQQKAIDYFKIAAENGHVEANTQLGNIYLRGRGVASSISNAVRYFEAAVKAGSERALLSLGDLYFIQRDNTKALATYERAVELGDIEGKVRIGKAYLNKARFPGRKDEGIQILDELSSEGVASASILLANLYSEGKSDLPQDNAKALSYFDAAIQSGSDAAAGARLALLAQINNDKNQWANLEVLYGELSEQAQRGFLRMSFSKTPEFAAYLAQVKLTELNYYTGPLDGIFGSGSNASMRAFCLDDAQSGPCASPSWSAANLLRLMLKV